jgi:NifB/MoaA-like Fe-S oxidoreductase
MRYITDRDQNLANKLQRLLSEACKACPDVKVAELRGNNVSIINEDITEYVLVWFFPGRQVCVHRTINEGVSKLGCDILRVWQRSLPDDVAVEQLTAEVRRMLGHRIKVREEIEEFRRAALEIMAEGVKL